jgi:hypothetical protein
VRVSQKLDLFLDDSFSYLSREMVFDLIDKVLIEHIFPAHKA